jgi:hypothetical protein
MTLTKFIPVVLVSLCLTACGGGSSSSGSFTETPEFAFRGCVEDLVDKNMKAIGLSPDISLSNLVTEVRSPAVDLRKMIAGDDEFMGDAVRSCCTDNNMSIREDVSKEEDMRMFELALHRLGLTDRDLRILENYFQNMTPGEGNAILASLLKNSAEVIQRTKPILNDFVQLVKKATAGTGYDDGKLDTLQIDLLKALTYFTDPSSGADISFSGDLMDDISAMMEGFDNVNHKEYVEKIKAFSFEGLGVDVASILASIATMSDVCKHSDDTLSSFLLKTVFAGHDKELSDANKVLIKLCKISPRKLMNAGLDVVLSHKRCFRSSSIAFGGEDDTTSDNIIQDTLPPAEIADQNNAGKYGQCLSDKGYMLDNDASELIATCCNVIGYHAAYPAGSSATGSDGQLCIDKMSVFFSGLLGYDNSTIMNGGDNEAQREVALRTFARGLLDFGYCILPAADGTSAPSGECFTGE